jgi:N-acetylglucosamine kinase-like BadF-type ATPase
MACLPDFGCVAAVLAGTGTVAIGESGGKRCFAGGWGPEFDDAGGGGRIGKDAVTAFLLALDRREKRTSLSKLFRPLITKKDLNTFAGRMALKSNIFKLTRKQMADYAPRVFEHYKKGDAVARAIITRAAKDIAVLAAAVLPEKSNRKQTSILCLGGIFNLGKEFRSLCSKYLRTLRPAGELVFPDHFDLSRGACLMALKMAALATDDKIIKAILKK